MAKLLAMCFIIFFLTLSAEKRMVAVHGFCREAWNGCKSDPVCLMKCILAHGNNAKGYCYRVIPFPELFACYCDYPC
ncbi:hypothetical protein ACHQM5_008444 [Ranunculus cassubicifolius]